MDFLTSSKQSQRTNETFGEPLNLRNQASERQSRYSLPANFETMYSSNSYSNNGGGYHANRQRPVSAYSDHHVVYGDQNSTWFDNGGGSRDGGGYEVVPKYHMYPQNQHLLSEMSDNHRVYTGVNGYHGSGPETFHHQQSSDHHFYNGTNSYQQPHNERPFSAHAQYHHSYTNTSESKDKPGDFPHRTNISTLKTSHSKPGNHFSMISSSTVSQSTESQNSISQQEEYLALEQKRLEDHFAALQGQLLADFQKRQQELIEVYNRSLETHSVSDRTMQSILEKSFESDSDVTLVSSTTDKENFTILRTEELPQSPFGINVKKKSSVQNGEVNSRSFRNSTDRRKQGSNFFANLPSPNGKVKTNNRARLAKSASSGNTRLMKDFRTGQKSVSQDQRFTNISAQLFQKAIPPDPRKSFNSEVSAQEYYEMPRFNEKFEGTEIVGNNSEGNRARGSKDSAAVGKTGRNSMRNFGVITSPKRTQLNSFESQVHVVAHSLSTKYTRVKTHKLLQVCKQVVTSLFTSCEQVVFALLVPSLL